MKDKDENIKERAKKLLELKINENITFFDIKYLRNKIPELNYLVSRGYILERGDTVRSFYYEITLKGEKWTWE